MSESVSLVNEAFTNWLKKFYCIHIVLLFSPFCKIIVSVKGLIKAWCVMVGIVKNVSCVYDSGPPKHPLYCNYV